MRTYYEIMKIALKNSLAYRLDTLISILGSIIALYVQIYLWRSLYGDYRISQLSLHDMITYQIMGIILSLLYTDTVAREVGGKVLDGSISLELLRPYNFAAGMFSRTLGDTLSGFAAKGIAVIIFAVIVLNFRLKISLLNVLLLMVALVLNIIIYWLLHYMIGLLHFTFLNAGWFVRILRDTVRILGGGVIPLWFFPDVLREISYFLPFQLLYQFPQSLSVNKISTGELLFNLTAACSWIVLLGFGTFYLWKTGIKKLIIQGG
ncbi:MAG TPA: ABC-2 family transporter protein [Methylomusa anaerophila]|uniref:ABC-2 family transporter protein n=1 Tax=Methylomusa anaerophila TaxID=1930071 RepID=A0A348AES9_9FIRM|nr:ABC-2 family transporter protein [Methylomusa anaerophila]BBB89577.1 hypothetical protein MAMMFC1_00210 [Methylomusa anaerophila]HML89649.1 ABC-2 family transporter protein [Methylomusa anaerophila]